MVISLVVAHLWGVLQLLVLASFARTVRARTAYAALAAGLYLCAPVTAALQVALTKIVASSMGMSVSEVMYLAGYTLDPFIEEFAKVLPLLMLLMVPLFRRQWSFTDCVLIAASTGAGFGLAEDIYRFGGSADHAQSIAGGWALVFSGHYLLVPGIGKILTSWLPHGVAGSQDAARLNEHLIWSAVAGLAVGLMVLARTTAARLTALALFVCMSLDHAARNMSDIGDSWLAYLSWPLRALAHVRALMPPVALGAAWWLDQQRQGARVAFGPLLEAEQSGSSRLRGTLAAAVGRLPWSLIAVDRFVRMRRAVRTERGAAQAVPLNEMLMNERNRVDLELAKWRTMMPALWPSGWSPRALRTALRRPTVVLWLVIMAPSVLYFVVGGWPQTAGLQAFMLQPLVAKVLFPISVLAQAWISWRTIAGVRARSRTLSIGDDAALVGLRAACGVGAVSLGVFSLLRMLGGLAPGASLLAGFHAQSAANRLTPGAGSMLSDGGGAIVPPPPPEQQPGAESGASSGSPGNDSSNSNGPGQPPSAVSQPPPPAPAPAPDPVATADQDLADAQQRRLDAQSALESAEIKQATGAADDPAVMAAQERANAARDAANAADIKTADDFKDPWAEKSANQAAADEARAQSQAADAARDDAVNAAQPKLDADAQAAQAADQQANADVAAAEAKAELAKADADAKAAAAQSAAEQNAAAQQKSADPQGFAADEAAKAAAAAQKRADDAFMDTSDPTGEAYHAANEAAQQARQQADAARAAADAAKAGRDGFASRAPSSDGKPFKP